ncbi:mucin-21 [Anabrus simplex]|uniref:mucin-21 n=1 Tax=Anabrus simplex TaxID=316456 RepID=UPI0035A3A8B5
MSPSSCMGPPPLLRLVLCWLLFCPTLGFPAGARTGGTQDLAESASGDDLISGRDFLSIFIGASLGPRSGRTRNFNVRNKVGEDPEQSISSFGARTVVRNRNSLQSTGEETSGESSPRFEDLSDSDTPSVEFVSFDSSKMDKNPIPDATTGAINVPNSGVEFQSEKFDDSNKYGSLGSDASEHSSMKPAELSTDSKTLVSTASEATHSSDSHTGSHSVTQSINSDEFTVITDIVTSKEELSSTEPLLEAESQDASTQVRSIAEFNSNQHKDSLQGSKLSQITPKSSQSYVPVPVTITPIKATYNTTGLSSTTYSLFSPSPTESTRLGVSILPETTVQTPSPPIQQVISVKVSSSSSVVQGPLASPVLARPKNTNRIDSGRTKLYSDGIAQTPVAPISDEDMQRRIDTDPPPSTTQPIASEVDSVLGNNAHPQEGSTALVTEEQPAATAVQRSQFSVEEASPSSSALTTNQQAPPLFQHKAVATVIETTRKSQIRPVSYQSSVSTATSDSRVHFYREPPIFQSETPSVAESVQTSVVASHRGSMQANYERISGQPLRTDENIPIESRMGRYGEPHHEVRISGPTDRGTSFSSSNQKVSVEVGRSQKSITSSRHHEPVEKNYEVPERSYGQPERSYGQQERTYGQQERTYGQQERIYGQQERAFGQQERTYGRPERTYGQPEQNYEVDEAVSVVSNGRAYGVQTTTQNPVDPNHKIAYVMEGSNYRKYRVEERTSDGFIVGEYGVVSHDDGSLRGVRYTADGTINPRLIQEALVKFLSL